MWVYISWIHPFYNCIINHYYAWNLSANNITEEKYVVVFDRLLCRLTPPLCLNFLGLIHLDSHVIQEASVEETDYTKIMGHMDVISFISDGFNIYFPILIVLLCIATYFNLCGRCLHFLGFQQYIGEDDLTQELVDEGKELIRRGQSQTSSSQGFLVVMITLADFLFLSY